MKQTLKIISFSALATAALIKGVPAMAEPVQQNVAIVSTADLDLSTPVGRSRLDVRLAHAAEQVCGPTSSIDLAGANAARQCRQEVLASARAQGQALLAAAKAPSAVVLAAR